METFGGGELLIAFLPPLLFFLLLAVGFLLTARAVLAEHGESETNTEDRNG